MVEAGAVNAAGERLALSFHPAGDARPVVVLCHGMLAHRQGKVRRIAEALQSAGVSAVRFDHAGCGESEGALEPIRVERRLGDLAAVLDWITALAGAPTEIAFAGSSMGAAVSLVAAAERGARAWAGIATPLDLWDGVRPAASGYGGRGLVVWGDADEVVPPADSGWLVRRWGERAEALTFAGGDHRLQPWVDDISRAMAGFFAARLLLRGVAH